MVFTPDPGSDLYRIRQISDLVGYPITLNYDIRGRLENITQSDGKPPLSLAYAANGFLSTATRTTTGGEQLSNGNTRSDRRPGYVFDCRVASGESE